MLEVFGVEQVTSRSHLTLQRSLLLPSFPKHTYVVMNSEVLFCLKFSKRDSGLSSLSILSIFLIKVI